MSDCLLAISGFVTYLIDKDDSFFKINTTLSLIALWSSAYWSSALGVFLYQKIAKARGFNSGLFYQRSLYVWSAACVLVPIVLIMVVFSYLGIIYTPNDNRFEKVASSSQHIIIYTCLEVVPFMVCMLINWISYIKQIQILKEFDLFTLVDLQPSKLLRYPIAQCLIFLPSLICKTIYIFLLYNSTFGNAIRMFGYYLAGFINTLAYGTQKSKEGAKSSMVTTKVFPASFDISDHITVSDEPEEMDEERYREL